VRGHTGISQSENIIRRPVFKYISQNILVVNSLFIVVKYLCLEKKASFVNTISMSSLMQNIRIDIKIMVSCL